MGIERNIFDDCSDLKVEFVVERYGLAKDVMADDSVTSSPEGS